MTQGRRIPLFRDGRSQIVVIPQDFAMPGDKVVLRKEGDNLIIEPPNPDDVIELLDSWEPIDEDFPLVEDPPSEPEDIF